MIQERVKSIWEKITTVRHRGISFGVFLLFSLLFSCCGFRSSAFAESRTFGANSVFAPEYIWYTSEDEDTVHVSAGHVPIDNEWRTWSNYTRVGLTTIGGQVRIDNTINAFSYQITIEMFLYATPGGAGNQVFTYPQNCDGLQLVGYFSDGNASIRPEYQSTQILTCEEYTGNNHVEDYHVVAVQTLQFSNPVSPYNWYFYFENPIPTTSVPGNGWIFSCGMWNSSKPCPSQLHFGISGFSATIDYTNDATVALLQKQLALQREEAEERAKDRSDLGDISITGGDEASAAQESAALITDNFLSAIIYIRDAALSVHYTDCKLNTPQVNFRSGGSFSLGSVNFCALSIPEPIAAISGLAMFGFVLWWSVALLRDFYNVLSDLFFGGNSK